MPVQQARKPHQIHKIDRSNPSNNACYHWTNTMNGGAPKQERDYRFVLSTLAFWVLILFISWSAYQVAN